MAKKDTPQIEKPKARIYTKEELETFDKQLLRFWEDYTIETGKEKGKVIKVLNYKKLKIAYGATDTKGGVIPERQAMYENLMDQWGWWKGGQDWAQKKRLENYDQMAKEISEEKKLEKKADEEYDGL